MRGDKNERKDGFSDTTCALCRRIRYGQPKTNKFALHYDVAPSIPAGLEVKVFFHSSCLKKSCSFKPTGRVQEGCCAYSLVLYFASAGGNRISSGRSG